MCSPSQTPSEAGEQHWMHCRGNWGTKILHWNKAGILKSQSSHPNHQINLQSLRLRCWDFHHKNVLVNWKMGFSPRSRTEETVRCFFVSRNPLQAFFSTALLLSLLLISCIRHRNPIMEMSRWTRSHPPQTPSPLESERGKDIILNPFPASQNRNVTNRWPKSYHN